MYVSTVCVEFYHRNSTIITVRNGVREGNVFSRVCQSVNNSVSPHLRASGRLKGLLVYLCHCFRYLLKNHGVLQMKKVEKDLLRYILRKKYR